MTGRQRKPRAQAEATSTGTTPGREQQYASARPKFVIEIWAHPRFRERDPGRPLTLGEALEVGRKPVRQPEPDPEPEAEP